jgi:outer membrane protein OmpA-like peptidoglycan-associated protein
MKRITLLLVVGYFLISCGGGKEAVSESGVSEDVIVQSLEQQDGERPVILPENLSPKIPPQKVISSSAKTIEVTPAPKEDVKIVEAQPVSPAEITVNIKPAVVEEEPVTENIPPREIIDEPVSPELLALQTISFDDIYFESGEWVVPSSKFSSNYYVTLGKLVKILKADPNVKIRISGYTDSQGSKKTNYKIAEKRALTFGKLLVELFPEEKKMEIAERIEINPVGSSDLLVESKNVMRRMLNRRVSFELFYGDLEKKPYAMYLDSRPVAAPTRAVESASSIQKKLYDKAIALYNRKRYDESIEIFEEIIQIDKTHSLADNAQFWIGEGLYFQKRYPEALQAYQLVFGLGDRNKEAYAQLRLGYCYFRMNQLEQAAAEIRKVTRNYPKATEENRKAEMLLSKIKSY